MTKWPFECKPMAKVSLGRPGNAVRSLISRYRACACAAIREAGALRWKLAGREPVKSARMPVRDVETDTTPPS